MREDHFTPTQVGTLLEAMDKKIDLIAETVIPMKEDITVLKERVSELSSDMRTVKQLCGFRSGRGIG